MSILILMCNKIQLIIMSKKILLVIIAASMIHYKI